MVFCAVLVSFSSVSPVLQGLHKTAACLVCLVSERIWLARCSLGDCVHVLQRRSPRQGCLGTPFLLASASCRHRGTILGTGHPAPRGTEWAPSGHRMCRFPQRQWQPTCRRYWIPTSQNPARKVGVGGPMQCLTVLFTVFVFPCGLCSLATSVFSFHLLFSAVPFCLITGS